MLAKMLTLSTIAACERVSTTARTASARRAIPSSNCIEGSPSACPCTRAAAGTNGSQGCEHGRWSVCHCQPVAELNTAIIESLLSDRTLTGSAWRFDPRERRELSRLEVMCFNMTLTASFHVRSFDINGGSEWAGRVQLRGEWNGTAWMLREEPRNIDFAQVQAR